MLECGVLPAFHLKRDHPAETAHLSFGDVVVGVVRKSRVVNPGDPRVRGQQLNHNGRVLVVPIHANTQRLDPSQYQPTIPGSRYRTHRVLVVGQLFTHLCGRRDERATDHI